MQKILLAAAIPLLLTGCLATPEPAKTSLEIQAIQARSFDADRTTTFRSVLSVLQDLGYVVASASLETGFITAESPIKQDQSGGAVLAAVFGGVRTEGRTTVTASVEDLGPNSTRVRLNFVNKVNKSGMYGMRSTDEAAVHNPKVYENAFEKISEAIFIRKAQK